MLQFTVFSSTVPDYLTKRFTVEDGAIRKESGGQLVRGRAERVGVATLAEFWGWLEHLASHQAVGYGVTGRASAEVVTKDKVTTVRGAVARSREHFAWPAGPGILMLDFDGVEQAPRDLIQIIRSLAPCLAEVWMLWRPSASMGIRAGELALSGTGQRLYIPVLDARLIPEAGAALVDLLWLAGHGRIQVGAAGQLLERCLVDASVWQPERLDFAGPPILGDGVVRDAPGAFIDGSAGEGWSDLRELVALATPEVREAARSLREDTKRALRGESEERRQRWVSERAPRYAARTGTAIEEARDALTRVVEQRELPAGFELVSAEGERVRVLDLIGDPDRWNGARFADALEPDYRDDPRIAVALLDDRDHPALYSHAHGGIRYRLPAVPGRLAGVMEADDPRVLWFFATHARVPRKGGTAVTWRERRKVHDREWSGLEYRQRDMSLKALGELYSSAFVAVTSDGGKTKVVPLVSYWARAPMSVHYRGSEFRPVGGLIAGDLTMPDDVDILNDYQGLSERPRPGQWSHIEYHLRHVICDSSEERYQYLLNWIALAVQKPEQPGEVIIVLQSAVEGTGKSTLGKLLVRWFGEYGVEFTEPEHLLGKFNAGNERVVMGVLSELTWGGDKRHEGKLKALVTDSRGRGEIKGGDQVNIGNHAHLVVTTNSQWPVSVGLFDRRTAFFDVSARHARDSAYFTALNAAISGGESGAFLAAMLARDISRFDVGAIPGDSAGKRRAQLLSLPLEQRWLVDVIEEGVMVDEKGVDLAPGWAFGEVAVDTARVYAACAHWARDQRGRIADRSEFRERLSEICPVGRRRSGEAGRPYRLIFPHLGVCREQVARLLGGGKPIESAGEMLGEGRRTAQILTLPPAPHWVGVSVG